MYMLDLGKEGFMAKVSKKKMDYSTQYSAEHYTRVTLKFKKSEDTGILEFLKSQPSMTDYVRQCVKRDIAKMEGNENE